MLFPVVNFLKYVVTDVFRKLFVSSRKIANVLLTISLARTM